MPLVSRDPEVERIEMPNGDWYELRTQLGWYFRNKVAMPNAMKLHMPWGAVKDGDIHLPTNSDLVPVTLENMVEVQLSKLAVYIKAWSHPDHLNENTVKRIPPDHARRLLERIEELEAAQDGPAEDSPLGGPSVVSLEAQSYRVEPPSV